MRARTGTSRRGYAPLAVAAAMMVSAALIGIQAPPSNAEQDPAAVAQMVAPPVPPRETGTPAPSPAGLAVAAVDAPPPGATIGVAVLDRSTGRTAVGPAEARPMYSASLVKIIVAVDVLDQRRDGLPVSPEDIELIRRALGPSDDRAMNELWVRFDGSGAVGRVATRLGLAGTSAPEDPSQWGETLMSARDVVALYDYVLTEMAAADRALIMDALAAAPATATDGFDQAFGLMAGSPEQPVASKQGWMCCQEGRITLHSAGVLGTDRRFVVALLSSVPRDLGYEGAREVVTSAAGSVRASLT